MPTETSQNVTVSRSHLLNIKGEVINSEHKYSKKTCNKLLNTDTTLTYHLEIICAVQHIIVTVPSRNELF